MMIIKSTVRGNGAELADYLLQDKKNDRVELLDMRGWTAATLKNALRLSEDIARTKTHCEKPFYHVSFRLPAGEALTPEQWQHCADTLEQRLGLDGHHRAMVMHTYKGEKHLHVVWDRIDEHTLKAVNLFQDRPKCKEVARALEKELGLQRVRDEKREPEKELAALTRAEEQQARRKGQDLQEIRAAIREAWEQSANGPQFAEALGQRGLVLAQGERRDYVALDAQGGVYSIGKRTTGATTREVREKLADLDREYIPTVAQARTDLLTCEPEQKPEHAKEMAQEAVSLREEPHRPPPHRNTRQNAPQAVLGPRTSARHGAQRPRRRPRQKPPTSAMACGWWNRIPDWTAASARLRARRWITSPPKRKVSSRASPACSTAAAPHRTDPHRNRPAPRRPPCRGSKSERRRSGLYGTSAGACSAATTSTPPTCEPYHAANWNGCARAAMRVVLR